MVELAPDQVSSAAPDDGGVATATPTNPLSLKRKNRWKRRGGSVWPRRALIMTLVLVPVLAGLGMSYFTSEEVTPIGPDGAFGKAVFDAFPEADPSRIALFDRNNLANTATIHLPAHLIEPGLGIGNPFARLGAEFGGAERTLSGVEMASRLENISNRVLPNDVSRCYSYEIGKISSEPEAPHRKRMLHIYLNPGC